MYCVCVCFFFKLQDYKTITDSAEPHLLLDVRPLVEVDICHLPCSLSILLFERRLKQSHLISDYPCVFAVLILFPDIPLSCLEERRSEDLRLLKERISQLRGQMSGDCRPAGNVKTAFKALTCCIFTVHCVVWYRLILASLLQVVTGLLGDLFFPKQVRPVDLSSWPDLKKSICKILSMFDFLVSHLKLYFIFATVYGRVFDVVSS